jgi:lipopolysaccharide transport system permease protein
MDQLMEQLDESATGSSIVDDDAFDGDPVEVARRSGASRGTGALPLLVIRPTAGWRAIDFAELWRFRELLFFLAWRDIMVRYKQTVLGAAWAVIQPVMTMIVFTVFFGRLGGMARYAPEGVPYQVFVYSALLPWQFFSFGLAHGGISLIQSERLISKVYFPRLLLPFSTVGTGIVDFLVSCCVLACMMRYYQIGLTWNLLLLPVLVVGMTLAALGAATILASLSVTYRDFRYIIPFLAQIWMFSSPVAYPISLVEEHGNLLYYCYSLNPMAGIIDGYCSAFLGQPIHWDALGVSLTSAAVLFVVGLSYFRRGERRFADIV